MECLLPDISLPKQFLQLIINAKNVLKERCHLLSYLVFCFPLLLFSQPEIAEIRHFGKEVGLNLSINRINQDESGILWLLSQKENSYFSNNVTQFLQFDGRESRTLDTPHPEEFIIEVIQNKDDQLIIHYVQSYFDVFDTKTGQFETVDLGHLAESEDQEILVWSSDQYPSETHTVGIRAPGKILLATWDEELDILASFDRQESQSRLWGFFQHDDFYWFSDATIGWVKYNRHTGQWKKYAASDFEGEMDIANNALPPAFKKAVIASNGDIMVAVWFSYPGYFKYNADQDKFEAIPGLPDKLGSNMPFKDKEGRVLFSYLNPDDNNNTDLWLMNLDGSIQDYSPLIQSLDRSVNCVFSENFTDHLWLGTTEGLTYVKFHPKEKVPRSLLPSYSMRNMIELEPGKSLLTTELNGWFLWDEARDTIQPFPVFQNGQPLTTSFCRGLYLDKVGSLWASNDEGFLKVNVASQQAEFYKSPVSIQAFTRLKNGQFLLVSIEKSAPYLFDTTTGIFSEFMPPLAKQALDQKFGHTIIEASNGIIWVGTTNGLVKLDKSKQKTKIYSKKDGFKSDVVLSIYEEPDGKLWLGTGDAGVHLFDPKSEQVTIFQEIDGLSNNSVPGILKDKDGDFWFSTFDGISCYKPAEHTFLNFNVEHGFSHHEFNRYSFYQKSDGQLCFGTIQGMNLFDPQALKGKPAMPKLLLREAQFFDQSTGQQVVRHHFPSQLSSIKLPPANRYLRLRFGLSDLENADLHQFSYFLEGYDQDWNDLGAKNEIIFNNLPVGNYTLHLQGLSARGERNINPVKIDIHIAQYFYKSIWFLLLCLVLASGAVFWWIMRLRTQKNRLEAEVRRRTENIRMDKILIEEQANQLKELDQFKTRFYTNLTHEFRTPLTVILGMATKMKTHLNAEKLIVKNARNLLRLINQLLDLSKLEAGVMDLNLEKGDLVGFVHFIAESFESYAATRNVRLQSHAEMPNFITHFDKDKMRHIVVNLVSNAIKFSTDGGKVLLQTSRKDENILIKVQDNGIGIPADKLPYVFDRFYQADDSATRAGEGTGIGLALVKELVQLMDGQIDIQSQPGWGTSITVTLPMQEATDDAVITSIQEDQQWLEADLPAVHQIEMQETTVDSDKLHLLVVEDNRDLTAYFQTCLEKDYNVTFAYDGNQGIEKAFELIPDLVITDVMMPEKDGYEVCQTLKSDIRTSHIPIIILTAKADFDSKMQGLQTGADAFLSKPFEEDELLLRLQKLNELREQLKDKYTNNLQEIKQPSLEDQFLQQLRDCIEASIDDPDFEILHLCRAVHLSHSQVYRKIKALTGKTPSTFIRSVRLQKARELLKTTQKSVSEIAWDVGFANPNHFSSAFKEEFGLPPSAIRK